MYKYNPEQTFEDGDIHQNPVEDNNETTGPGQMEKEAPQDRTWFSLTTHSCQHLQVVLFSCDNLQKPSQHKSNV